MTTLLLLLTLAAPAADPPATAATSATTAASDAWTGLTALDGSAIDPASLRGKAVLVVNVASKCGYTKQYAGLQALFAAQKDAGLVVVGAPCNQFGGQEPGSPEEIASFCRMTYGVEFPMLAKQDVNGPDRSALYAWLVGSEAGGGKDIKWNFEKFLVSPAGDVVGRWGSGTKPDAAELVEAIERVLPKS